MTNDELSTRYRNLIIALCRHQKSLTDKSVLLRSEAKREMDAGRRSGLYCLARSYSKHGHALKSVIRRNSAVLRQFFKTTNIETVSKKEILLTRKRSGSTVAPAQNKTTKAKP